MIFIDLTHIIHNNMPRFGAYWHCDTQIEPMGKVVSEGRNTSKLTFGSHAGTHMDSPRHFLDEGRTIDQIDVSELIGPVKIVDFSFLGKNECVTLEMIRKIELAEKMIFRFDWSKVWEKGDFYHEYPYFSDEAADYIVNSQKVKFIGMDTPSPDDSRITSGSPEDSKIHKKFLRAGIILVEYLNNLDKIEDLDGWTLAALPLKLENCDGSPIRAVIYK